MVNIVHVNKQASSNKSDANPDDDQMPMKPQIDGAEGVVGDFSELPMLSQKHLGKDASQADKKSHRMGLIQDEDSVGGTNSNPNLQKGMRGDPTARSILDPRGSAAPNRLINKVRGDKVMLVYHL